MMGRDCERCFKMKWGLIYINDCIRFKIWQLIGIIGVGMEENFGIIGIGSGLGIGIF